MQNRVLLTLLFLGSIGDEISPLFKPQHIYVYGENTDHELQNLLKQEYKKMDWFWPTTGTRSSAEVSPPAEARTSTGIGPSGPVLSPGEEAKNDNYEESSEGKVPRAAVPEARHQHFPGSSRRRSSLRASNSSTGETTATNPNHSGGGRPRTKTKWVKKVIQFYLPGWAQFKVGKQKHLVETEQALAEFVPAYAIEDGKYFVSLNREYTSSRTTNATLNETENPYEINFMKPERKKKGA